MFNLFVKNIRDHLRLSYKPGYRPSYKSYQGRLKLHKNFKATPFKFYAKSYRYYI